MSIRVGTIAIPLVTNETDEGHVSFIPCDTGTYLDTCVGIVVNTDKVENADDYEDAYVLVRWIQTCEMHKTRETGQLVHISNLWEVGHLA